MCTICCLGQLCNYKILVQQKEHEHLVLYGHGKLKFNISTYTQIRNKEQKDSETFKHKNLLG